eukprot:m.343593 g.343593  ORF g.343593 m.343593 type:complete len:63 (+) comp20634_c0_seq1:116-304(+)
MAELLVQVLQSRADQCQTLLDLEAIIGEKLNVHAQEVDSARAEIDSLAGTRRALQELKVQRD